MLPLRNLIWHGTILSSDRLISKQAAGWTAMELWFKPQQEQGIFLYSKMSTPVLRPTQPPTQRAQWALSLGRKADSA